MRDFVDKDWDEKYRRFKLLKERRKMIESNKLSLTSESLKEGNSFVHKNGINSKKEERNLLNVGPSRYLMAHSANLQERHMSKPQIENVSTVENSAGSSSNELFVVNDENKSQAKRNIWDILPYLFIVLGAIIVILVLTNAIPF